MITATTQNSIPDFHKIKNTLGMAATSKAMWVGKSAMSHRLTFRQDLPKADNYEQSIRAVLGAPLISSGFEEALQN